MTKIKILLQIFTVLLLTLLILYRFRLRIPRDIFTASNTFYFYIYFVIFMINIFLFIIFYLHYKKYEFKTNHFSVIGITIKTWFDNSYAQVLDIVANFSGPLNTVLVFITNNYIKFPVLLLQIIVFVPKIFFCIALSIDVFVFAKFYYSYILIYFLLITLISKAILYISIEMNTRMLEECTNSIEAINFDILIKDYENDTLNKENYILTKYNTQFLTTEHVFKLSNLLLYELKQLEIIRTKIETPLLFTIALRGFYVIVFGYIVLKYFLYFI